jgi:hypothetical protein
VATVGGYRQSTNSMRSPYCFADPTLEFQSLDDARTFAQAAAGASQFQADLFRIATSDRKINEHWIKDGNDWKLIPNRYKARLVRVENHSGIPPDRARHVLSANRRSI